MLYRMVKKLAVTIKRMLDREENTNLMLKTIIDKIDMLEKRIEELDKRVK